MQGQHVLPTGHMMRRLGLQETREPGCCNNMSAALMSIDRLLLPSLTLNYFYILIGTLHLASQTG